MLVEKKDNFCRIFLLQPTETYFTWLCIQKMGKRSRQKSDDEESSSESEEFDLDLAKEVESSKLFGFGYFWVTGEGKKTVQNTKREIQ